MAELFDDLPAFISVLPQSGGLLAIDASKRRLGFAGTDPRRLLITPLSTMQRRRLQDDLEAIQARVVERAAVGIVLGLPLNMDGSEGPMAVTARYLGNRLALELALPVLMQDERLTSFAVEDAFAEGRWRRPKRDAPVDHYAAAVILADALKLDLGGF
ncbi:putative holliday junction resolvase [Arboricoccus pini]|uniref:Putative pre-16S rRNA nuclease n=1 Tax=Arboricoccus pini TaxID=1963835 RepID=A0A212R774_9PROT|nr:Holliday junction resolvase RuvX [Arboricoccus pini]SNB67873.1 putative holliday junction resolvase [Arboricoccus pini]